MKARKCLEEYDTRDYDMEFVVKWMRASNARISYADIFLGPRGVTEYSSKPKL